MKKIHIIWIGFIIVLPGAAFTAATNNNTLYVDDDGTAEYTSIQDAIDAANDGDTIYVYKGMYQETIDIDKSLIIKGEDRNTTIINGTNKPSLFTVCIDAPNVRINGFSLIDADWDNNGQIISVHNKNSIIQNNRIITNVSFGIKLYPGSNQNQILNNYVTAIHTGIKLESSWYNNIMGNQVVGGRGKHGYGRGPDHLPIMQLDGISAEHSHYNNITFNHIAHNGMGLSINYCNSNSFTKNNFINGGNTKTIGNKTIILSSSNVYARPLITVNYWNENYWDDWYGLLPFQLVTGSFIPWGIWDFIKIDWNPAIQPYDIARE